MAEYIKRFVAEAKSGKRLTSETKKKYTYGTCRVLTGFMQSFEKFCNEKGKQYDFNDIDQDFYNDFIQFFYDRKCSGNYAGRRIANLKTIMRAAREEGLHTNIQTETRAFKTIKSEVDNIYLTADEIETLYKMDLSDNKPYEIARDVFLVGVYTAQRYSDYSRINKNNIRMYGDTKVIELHQQKTGEKCIIPISPECEAILKKYHYNLPRTHEQKINEYIKQIGEKAKIIAVIQYEQNIGGMTVKKKAFKFEMIKTHTARRSGCTLMYLAGVPTIDIMKISGHKSEKEFLKYIRLGK
jgi:integrase